MAKLIYVMNVSLDGYIADEDGKLDWTAPDEEFFSFVNDLERPVGTYLYGRRLYDLMQVWETDPAAAAQSPAAGEFAEIWQAADERDLTVGGPTLGAHAIAAGLVDEYHLFVWPVVVGGGKHFLPNRARLQLELLDERRFTNGVVYLRYRTQT